MAKVSKNLNEIINMLDKNALIDESEIESFNIDAKFINYLKENAIYIVDERIEGSVLHTLESILLTVIFAIIAKCNSFSEIDLFMKKHYDWLNKHIKYENGMPSKMTIQRVIGFINPKELENILVDTFKNFLTNNEPYYKDGYLTINDIKTMDGKTANSSGRKSSKNGEIAKMNAMSTQTETIKYIKGHFGHYVAPVKGNQETLEEQIKEYFEDDKLYAKAVAENYCVTTEKAHGTYEKREYIFTNDIDWLCKKEDWVGIKAIGLAKRTYEKDGKTVVDTKYYITDLDARRTKLISTAIREEWAIENKLHGYLDMVFKEDDNKSFLKNSQNNLNIIRKFCLGILKLFKEQTKLSMNSIRFLISMDFENEIEKIINTLYS